MEMQYYIKRIIKPTTYLLLFASFISCLTPIDFTVDKTGGRIIISGQISTMNEKNIVEIGRTADLSRFQFPESEATVTLRDQNGSSFSYIEDFSRPGTYVLQNYVGIPGQTYNIEITLFDGRSYESTPEKMPETSSLDSVYYEIVGETITDAEGVFTKENLVKVYANSTLTKPTTTFLKWNVEETFILSPTDFPDPFNVTPPPCYISQNADPQRIVLYDGSSITSKSIKNQLVASRLIDWSFLEKHYLTTYQSSITMESHEYWRKVNILANQVGSIFDSPPAEITGNVINVNNPREKVSGYFQAVNQTYQRFVIHSYELPFPILNGKCDFVNNDYNSNSYPFRCIECTSLRNSSYERPIWF